MSLPPTYSGDSVFEDGFSSVAVLPDDIASYTKAVDADFENTFTTNITKAISVNPPQSQERRCFSAGVIVIRNLRSWVD